MWDSHTFKADEIVHVFYLQRFKYRFCRYSHLDTISIALFRFIPFIIVRPIDTFEYHLPVINTVCQCLTQQRTQLQIVYWASFHRLQIQDLIHVLPVNNNGKPFFKIMSSQMRVDRPFPSMNGCATFISTYFAMISSNVVSGIFSITGSIASKYKQLAKRKFPFDMLSLRTFPAESYNPSKDSDVCHISPSRFPPQYDLYRRYQTGRELLQGSICLFLSYSCSFYFDIDILTAVRARES